MFKKILLPIDLQETELALRAVKIAVDEAKRHGAEIYALTVNPGFSMPLVASFFPDGVMQNAEKGIARELEKFIAANFPTDLPVHPLVSEGSPPERILEIAQNKGIDLIVIPSHAQTFTQVVLGSCAARVVEHAHCSVMVIKS